MFIPQEGFGSWCHSHPFLGGKGRFGPRYDCEFFVPVDGMYKSDPNLECFAWRERFDSPKG